MAESMKLSLRDAALYTLAGMGIACEKLTDWLIRFEFRLPNELQALNIVCEFDPNQLMMIGSVVLNVDQTDTSRIREVGEFLHRANYGFIPGNFELDYDTGQVRYRTSKCIDTDQDDHGLFLRVFSEVVTPYLVYGDALADVLLNGADPKESAENVHAELGNEKIFRIIDEIFSGFMNLPVDDEDETIEAFAGSFEGLEPYAAEGYMAVIRLFSALYADGMGMLPPLDPDSMDMQLFPIDEQDEDFELDDEDEESDEEEDQTDDEPSFFA